MGKFLFWFLYVPLVKFLQIVSCWSSALKKRREFEKKNLAEEGSKSFKDDGVAADFCFEFSSEGEFQQVASLIDDALALGKRLELVFFSPSVEKTVLDLWRRWPQQIRYLRYPLAALSLRKSGLNFTRWVTSKTLVLVRYDLFPEFWFWSLGHGHELKMVWLSFKKERESASSISFLKRLFLKRSQLRVYASDPDQALGTKLGAPGPCYDFRIEQVRRRVANRELKLADAIKIYPQLKREWDRFPSEKRLIFGNVWPSDFFLLKDLPKDVLLVIVPHKLETPIRESILGSLKTLGREATVVNSSDQTLKTSSTYLLNVKGALCELYPDFGKAYVGGGFETSIHSILEPVVAGSRQIACGPLHHRSTEYDLGLSLGLVQEVKTASDFTRWLASSVSLTDNQNNLQFFFGRYNEYRKEVISC